MKRKKGEMKAIKLIGCLGVFLIALGVYQGGINVEAFFQSKEVTALFLSLEFGRKFTTSTVPDQALSEDASEDDVQLSLRETVSESYFVPPSITAPTQGEKPLSEITIKTENNNGYGGVYLKNETGLALDIAAMLKKPYTPPMSGKGAKVLLVHTHGSEAYTPSGKNTYKPDDNDRTLDKKYNMIRIGNEIEKELIAMGIGVAHIEDIFDSPTYTGSYDRSLAAISAQMKKTPSIEVVIDIHRDAMITTNGTKYKAVTEVNGKKTAQLMLVMGTDLGGLVHKNWKTNLNFAVNLQSKLANQYEKLMRPVLIRKQRFNQHVTPASILVEVGTSGNTLDEALYAARLFAKALGDTLLHK